MVAFQLFGLSIYWYGIFYCISFILGYCFLSFLGKKGYFKSFPALQVALTQHLETLMIALLFGVLIGGRLGHVFIYDWGSFANNWGAILEVWKGGMSFIGGIIGVLLALLVCRFFFKLSRKEFVMLLDCLLVMVPLGIFFGRLGNFLNQELYGIIFVNPGFSDSIVQFLKTTHFLHVYSNVDTALRINTNLLAMLFEGLLLLIGNSILFCKMIKKQIFHVGKISSQFMIGYSVCRFFLEYLRNDTQAEFVGMFTKSQWFFMGVFVIGIITIFFFSPTPLSVSGTSQKET